MKKILVFSDTHRNAEMIKRIENIAKECDFVIHLGDYTSDVIYLKEILKDKLILVKGNGDLLSSCKDEVELEIEGVRFFITHGHRYNVKKTLLNIGMEALKRECNVVLYGHTHCQKISDYAGVKLINPGSFSSPATGICSYCYIVAWKGKVIPKIVEL